MLKRLFTKRQISIKFLDKDGCNVDTNLFDQKNYNDISQNGISLSALNIMHCASIHYSGRFRNSLSLRFVNSFIEVISSIQDTTNSTNGFLFSTAENNEFQARSSEVIAVGICIALTSKLFKIEKNLIGLIEGSGKRCDFYFIKNNLEYYIESKGRKGNINSAIQDIFNKKLNYDPVAPKYGVISHIPRSSENTSVTVVDPEFTPEEINKNERVKRLLLHYSKISYLSGFWRLGDLLKERYKKISSGTHYSEFDQISLDYGNVVKMGRSIQVSIEGLSAQVFIPRDRRFGFTKEIEVYTALFLMEGKLLKILEKQDFDSLLEYKRKEESLILNDSAFSILNDGSIFCFILTKELKKQS